ncbi:MAG: hypothetical protein RRA94_11310 [Bacteroidota bacterium]|nr:hypothetical protein [Bacteroidota bacterium]
MAVLKCTVLSMAIILLHMVAWSQQDHPGRGEVALPGTRQHAAATEARAPRIDIPEGLTVLIDPVSGGFHRAFGPALRIPGYDRITEGNIRDAAAQFLHSYRDVVGIAAERLRLQRITHVRGRWYLTWRQEHDGLEVLRSEVELRVFDNGNVAAFGASVFPDIRVHEVERLGPAAIRSAAIKGLPLPAHTMMLPVRRNAILPFNGTEGLVYRLVSELRFESMDGRKWISYVDVENGDLLWRYCTTHDIGSTLQAHGSVTLLHPNEPALTDMPFSDMYVHIGGTDYTTDADGSVKFDIATEMPVHAAFEGPWCRVEFADRTPGSYTGTVQPGGNLDMKWTDDNSHRFERILFYHTNYNHAYLKGIDADFNALDFQMPITVYFDSPFSNAQSGGDRVRFFGAARTSMRLADAPMVLYHELGHCVNFLFYQQLGAGTGMRNMTCQEGMADIHAAMLTDYPAIGLGVFEEDETKLMRSLVNDMRYPDSLTGEVHNDGQILSGAFWDLRKTTSLELVRDLSHFAKYGLPDDPDDATAFCEWFLETLIADDDDGDLANGTPHYHEVVTAFARHGIGPELFIEANFRHAPLADTDDTQNPYSVRFTLHSVALPGGEVQNVRVSYILNEDAIEQSIAARALGNGEYEAMIPAQPNGTIVSYAIACTEAMTATELRFEADPAAKLPYVFLVGYRAFFTDSFESDLGWTVGAVGDDATWGIWERADPEEADFRATGGPFIQPENDHTGDGELCFVTGSKGGTEYFLHVPNGRTSITSPVIGLRECVRPVLRLHFIFAIEKNQSALASKLPVLNIQVSDNGGRSWVNAMQVTEQVVDWTQLTIPLSSHIAVTDSFRVRIVLNQLFGALSDGSGNVLVDDFSILTADTGTSSMAAVQEFSAPASITSVYPHPVPASSSTIFSYAVSESGPVAIEIHDLLGRRIAAILNGYHTKGDYRATWDGQQADGSIVAPGTYIAVLIASGGVSARTVILR